MNVNRFVNAISISLLVSLTAVFAWMVYSDAQDLVSQKRWLTDSQSHFSYLEMLDAIDAETLATIRSKYYRTQDAENERLLTVLITDQAFEKMHPYLPDSRIAYELFNDIRQKRRNFKECQNSLRECNYDLRDWGGSSNELQLVIQNILKKQQESYLFSPSFSSMKVLSQQVIRWNSQFHRLMVYIEVYQKVRAPELQDIILDFSLILSDNSIYLNSDPELIEEIPGFWKKLLNFSALYQDASQKIILPIEQAKTANLVPISGFTLKKLYQGSLDLRDYLFDSIQYEAKQVYQNRFRFFVIELMVSIVILLLLIFAIYMIRNMALLPLAENETILKDAAIGIIQITPYGQILKLNRAAAKMFGYEEAELIERSILSLLPSSKRHAFEHEMQEYVEGKSVSFTSTKSEMDGLHKHGLTIPIEVSVSDVHVAGQSQFILLVSDLTEQKLAKQEIFKQNQFLGILKGVTESSVTHPLEVSANLQELMERLIKLIDAEYGFIAKVKMDESLETYLLLEALSCGNVARAKWLKKSLKGKLFLGTSPNLFELFDGNQNIETALHIRAIFEELLCPIELENQMILPIHQHGQLIGILGIASSLAFDSRVRHFLEPLGSTCNILFSNENYQALQTQLIAKLEERTQQALEAQKLSESAAQAKSHFLANMSHEIRTPMNAVIGLAHLTLENELSENQRQNVLKIQRAGHSLMGIINDILDFSKIESGLLELEQAGFDLEALVNHVAELVSTNIRDKQLEVIVDFDLEQKYACLIGDALRLEQVLTNLMSNAVKFTEQGTVTLKVKGVHVDHQVALTFSVIDTGIGIAEGVQESLFEEFTQADQSTTRKYGGTGLGLAISQRLVTLMGGKISIESALGVGSCFSFEISLPVNEFCEHSQAKEPPRFARRVVNQAKRQIDLLGLRVLLVEDNDINQEVATELLTSKNALVTIANNGQEALDILYEKGASCFDVILMDIQMPVMGGYEATIRIREDNGFDTVPIVAMTAHAMQDEIDKCLALGMQDYISKPISPETFYQVLCDIQSEKIRV